MSVATERRQIRLAEEADEQGLIENQTYQDAVILGPAVVAPIEDVTLDSNRFLLDPKGLFLPVPEGAPIQGAIGLRHVTFRRCEFHNVAIAGTPQVIADLRAQFEFPEPEALRSAVSARY